MAYKGQPVPSTTYQHGYFKVSDGKSVKVTVPPNSGPIKAGSLVYFGGFVGFAVRGEAAIQELDRGLVLENSDKPQTLIISIEQAEYETDQIDEIGDFKAGTQVYIDESEGEGEVTLTETAEGNRPVGRITVGKDDNDVIWMILGPQVVAPVASGAGEGEGEDDE